MPTPFQDSAVPAAPALLVASRGAKLVAQAAGGQEPVTQSGEWWELNGRPWPWHSTLIPTVFNGFHLLGLNSSGFHIFSHGILVRDTDMGQYIPSAEGQAEQTLVQLSAGALGGQELQVLSCFLGRNSCRGPSLLQGQHFLAPVWCTIVRKMFLARCLCTWDAAT